MKKTRIRELGENERVADAEARSWMLNVPIGTLQRRGQRDGWLRRHTTTHIGRRTLCSSRATAASYERRSAPIDDPPTTFPRNWASSNLAVLLNWASSNQVFRSELFDNLDVQLGKAMLGGVMFGSPLPTPCQHQLDHVQPIARSGDVHQLRQNPRGYTGRDHDGYDHDEGWTTTMTDSAFATNETRLAIFVYSPPRHCAVTPQRDEGGNHGPEIRHKVTGSLAPKVALRIPNHVGTCLLRWHEAPRARSRRRTPISRDVVPRTRPGPPAAGPSSNCWRRSMPSGPATPGQLESSRCFGCLQSVMVHLANGGATGGSAQRRPHAHDERPVERNENRYRAGQPMDRGPGPDATHVAKAPPTVVIMIMMTARRGGTVKVGSRRENVRKSSHVASLIHSGTGWPGLGAPPGTRTPNPLVKSQLLCQLS